MGSYSFGWTPLAALYPPEVLNYSIRSTGISVYQFFVNGLGLMATMAFPYALERIGWKTYMINGAWDVLQLVFVIVFWVETKGKTLEQIDEIFDGERHSSIDEESSVVIHGVGSDDVEVVEMQVDKI
jgi:hypothetical protein